MEKLAGGFDGLVKSLEQLARLRKLHANLRIQVSTWVTEIRRGRCATAGAGAGGVELIEYLKYTAPGFVYSVGLSPPNAAAALGRKSARSSSWLL